MMSGPRWYDADGNELHDMNEVEALLRDVDKRRIAFDQLDERTEVSTVLLVLDHNFFEGCDPLIFETMTFVDGSDVALERTSNKHAALAAHDRAVAEARERVSK